MLGKPNSQLSHLITFPIVMGLSAVTNFFLLCDTNTIMSCQVRFLFVTDLFSGSHFYVIDFLIRLDDKLTWGRFVTLIRAEL